MPKVVVIYDSRTGNTERMAVAVAEGARSVKGVDVSVTKVSGLRPVVSYAELRGLEEVTVVKPSDLVKADAIIIGSPTHYHTVTSRLSALLDKVVGSSLRGKVGAAFGSYLWEGEAVEDLNRAMIGSGMELVSQGVRVKGAPKDEDLSRCYSLGRGVAQRLLKK